jgi:hypothetical protein
MRDVISVYRGYSIFLSLGLNWSFTATPSRRTGQFCRAPNGNYPSQKIALETAKREIDDLLK